MGYLADTVALILHIGKEKRIGNIAPKILSEADQGKHRIFVSCMSYMEILYLSEKNRIVIDLKKVIQFVENVDNYQEVPITGQIVSIARAIDDVPELHDRIIAASAKYLDVPILTSDPVMHSSKYSQCVSD